jgi:hypothetical protein
VEAHSRLRDILPMSLRDHIKMEIWRAYRAHTGENDIGAAVHNGVRRND